MLNVPIFSEVKMSLLAFKLKDFCLTPGSRQSKQALTSFTLSIQPNIHRLLSTR